MLRATRPFCSRPTRRLDGRLGGLLLALFAVALLPPAAGAQSAEGMLAYRVPAINAGLPAPERDFQRDSPRATLDSFLEAVDRNEFARAAHALNLSHLPQAEQAENAPELAKRLAFLLQRNELVDWSEVPDRPDARVVPEGPQQTPPYQRRTVTLGQIKNDDRPGVPISLQRFLPADGSAVWLFSPYAVARIDQMYRGREGSLLRHDLSLEQRIDAVGETSPREWLAVGAILAGAILLWILSLQGLRLLARALPQRWRHPLQSTAAIAAVAVAAGGFRLGTDQILLTGPVTIYLGEAATLAAVIAAVWFTIRLLGEVSLALSRRYVEPLGQGDHRNRRLKTRVYVIRRTAMVAVGVVGLGYVVSRALTASGLLESFALSILASAGAAGVLVAIAARPLLGNVVAGLQIALTDPIRVGDAVVFEGQWAVVEDITFAYAALRTWTDTCLVVPHSELLSKPFENWSKGGEAVKRIVVLPVDYRVDVGIVRRRVAEIVNEAPEWTGEPARVEMVDATPESAVLWVWVSGVDSPSAWALHNEVREKLVALLRDQDEGAWLPRRRLVLADAPDEILQAAPEFGESDEGAQRTH